jgi:hypothetical protein
MWKDKKTTEHEMKQETIETTGPGEIYHLTEAALLLTCLLIELRPAPFILPFLNELLDRNFCDTWHLNLKACDVLDLLVRQSKLVFAQQIEVQVSTEWSVRNGWIRGCDHLCPGSNMFLVDVFDRVLESELKCDVGPTERLYRRRCSPWLQLK